MAKAAFVPPVLPLVQMSVFFLSRSVLSGVVASAVAASASEEGAKESERLLFVSTVSRPPDHILPAN